MIPFERVVIVGLGLVGGSWALALRRAGFAGHVQGVDPDARAGLAATSDAVDDLVQRALRPDDLRPGDLVVLAGPVGVSIALAGQIGPSLPPDAVVTDVGSAKRAVCAAWRTGLGAVGHDQFVGGHPMAGSHRTGFAAARADLFDDAPYFLVSPGDRLEAGAYERVVRTVQALGAVPVAVDADQHDRDVAVTSHLPQLVAWALRSVVRTAGPTLPGGPGLTGMTRLAASDWAMWSDVLAANGDLAVAPLSQLIDRLTAVRAALVDGDPGTLRSAVDPAGAGLPVR